jgi:lysozyme
MNLTPNGEAFIKSYEKLSLIAYPDPKTGGVPYTIGWGRAHGVSPHQTCTQEQADQWFLEDIAPVLSFISSKTQVPLLPQQVDALASWVYNVGAPKVAHATLWTKLNTGDLEGAADQLLLWDSPGSSAQAGLDARRHAERDIFLNGNYVLHN